jgi:uncharacterized protein (TIGR03437 family)
VEVTFDGTPAPLLSVQDSQINAVVPWALTPGQNTEICVSSSGAAASATETNCLTWPGKPRKVSASSPSALDNTG